MTPNCFRCGHPAFATLKIERSRTRNWPRNTGWLREENCCECTGAGRRVRTDQVTGGDGALPAARRPEEFRWRGADRGADLSGLVGSYDATAPGPGGARPRRVGRRRRRPRASGPARMAGRRRHGSHQRRRSPRSKLGPVAPSRTRPGRPRMSSELVLAVGAGDLAVGGERIMVSRKRGSCKSGSSSSGSGWSAGAFGSSGGGVAGEPVCRIDW